MSKKSASWRYQPVYREYDTGTKEYSICEVYLDKNEKLEMWTENYSIAPFGSGNIDDLIGDLELMIDDARKWKPVSFNSLTKGMIFERVEKQCNQ